MYKDSAIRQDEEEDQIDHMLDKYIRLVSDHEHTDALEFWKTHEAMFPLLALLARKYLSVQASSCAVERIFSIAGHIFFYKTTSFRNKFFFGFVIFKIEWQLIRLKQL